MPFPIILSCDLSWLRMAILEEKTTEAVPFYNYGIKNLLERVTSTITLFYSNWTVVQIDYLLT